MIAKRSFQRIPTLGEVVGWMMMVLLCASVTVNIIQAKRLRAHTDLRDTRPAPGTPVPALSLRTLDGKGIQLAFDRPTILYYFSPQCAWCQKNWLNVKALVAGTEGRYRFVGVSTSADVAKYLVDAGLMFEVYTGLSPESARVLNFGGTPHTVVVGAGGRVLQSWVGAYGGRQQREVEDTLGVILPGVPR